MLRIFYWLFCLVILFIHAECLDVYINNQNGTDQENCESAVSPCKTISYAYRKAMQNATLKQLNLLLQGNYKLDGSVYLNISHDVLSSLKLATADRPVQVIGADNYTFLFGCDECEYRSLKYNFLVEDLIFFCFRGFAAVKARFVDVSFKKCQFISNNCSSVYGIDAGVTVEECSFEWNNGSCDLTDVLGLGGAVRLVFRYHGNLNTTIKNSNFNNNSACLKEVVSPKLFDPMLHFKYYGGAVTAIYKNQSNGNTFEIDGCNFNGNKALFGGALYLSIAGKSSYNKFLISNSVFIENTAFTSGGAFAVKTYNRSSSNNITFKNIKFHRNLAVKSGGAGKILFQSLERHPTPMYFSNVSFTENRATMDGALGIGSNLRNIRIKDHHFVYFENVEFLRNAFYLSNSSYYYTGALKSHGIDLRFTGTVLFAENYINSALYLCAAFVEVDGNVTFYRNIASSNGGGISLTDGSTLLLKSGSSMLFRMNFAWMNGGAIYYDTSMVDNEVYSYNPICFLQYEKLMIPASQWNVSMRFIQNGAGVKGAAIYASTIRQCVWTEEYPFISYKKAFRWSDRFYYHDNYIGHSAKSRMRKIGEEIDIATDVYQFDLGGSKTVTAQPGDDISLNITAIDEYQQQMSSLAVITYSAYNSISSTSSPEIAIEDPLMYVTTSRNSSFSFRIASKGAYYKMKHRNQTRSEELNIIASNSVFGPRVNVKLDTQLCSLGYKFDTAQLKCVCDLDISELKWCGGDVLHIGMGYWANESQNTPNKLITFICPQRHCSCYHNTHEINCQFIASNPNRQCREEREGKLCGKCKQGKSISLPSYSCKDCTDRALSIFTLIFVIVLVLGICVAVIYFNPSYSEYLKGVFFYTQILPYLFNGNDISEQLALRFSTLINSVAVGSMPIEMCLFDGLDLIEAICLSYAIPLSAALVLIIVYLLSKYRFLTFRRDSPFGAFWILISVVYKFLAETSLLSLACFRVDDELVFFFDGSQKCFVGKHLALFIPSVLILIFIVLPLPIVIVLISYGYIRVSPHISDVIAKGYRTKYRWWCAVDFGRRLLFAAIFIFTPYLELRKVLLIFASVLTCLSHATILPYENKYANKGEAFLLAGLTLVAGLQAMQISTVQTTSSIIVVSATIIYTGLVITYLTYKKAYALYRKRKGVKSPNTRPVNCPASPVDVTGRPYHVPKRVLLADQKKAKKTRDSEQTLRQPLVQRGAENDL